MSSQDAYRSFIELMKIFCTENQIESSFVQPGCLPPLTPSGFREEDHARRPAGLWRPWSIIEEDHAHQGGGHVIHHESHQPFQRSEFENPFGSFTQPSYGPSEDLLPPPNYRPPVDSLTRPRSEPVDPRWQLVKFDCKADPTSSRGIRDGFVVSFHGNGGDKFPQSVQDEMYRTRVNDEACSSSFSVVNKGTGQVLKHGLGESQPMEIDTETQILAAQIDNPQNIQPINSDGAVEISWRQALVESEQIKEREEASKKGEQTKEQALKVISELKYFTEETSRGLNFLTEATEQHLKVILELKYIMEETSKRLNFLTEAKEQALKVISDLKNCMEETSKRLNFQTEVLGV